jgi:hypothetical protein
MKRDQGALQQTLTLTLFPLGWDITSFCDGGDEWKGLYKIYYLIG